MKSTAGTLKTVQFVVISGVLMAACAGCASQHKDLAQTSYLSLEPTLTAMLSHPPKVYEQNGGLVVEGRLEANEATYGGHVDVTVIGPDGTLVYDAAVNYKRPAQRPGGGARGSRSTSSPAKNHTWYSVRFPGLPPEGSVVRVKHRPLPHSVESGEQDATDASY